MKQMKRFTLFVLAVFALYSVFTIVQTADAVITPNIVTALNASAYTAISAPHIDKCRPITVWTSDDTAFWVSSNVSGTEGVLIPADSSYANSCVTDTAGVMLYAKASAGTPNLYMVIGLPK